MESITGTDPMPAGDPAPTTPPSDDEPNSINEMDQTQLQAELDRLERERARQETIERIRYLRSGGTLSAEQMRAQEAAAQQQGFPPESGRNHKRPATDTLVGYAKLFKPDPPKHFKGDDYQTLNEFIMGMEMYFEACRLDLSDPDVARTAIQSAATWLDGDARQSYYRLGHAPATWDDFLDFLRGTVKDPQTRLFDATQAAQFKRQWKDQGVRQFLHELEQAEAEVEAARLNEVERKMWRFLHSLRPELRNAIMAEPQEVRASRDTVLTAACRHELRISAEKSQKAKAKEHAPSESASKPSTSRGKASSGGSKGSHPNRVGNPTNPSAPDAATESNPSKPPSPFRCFNCGKEGHMKRDCTEKPKN